MRRIGCWAVLCVVAAGCHDDSGGGEDVDGGATVLPSFASNCTAGAISEEATRVAGRSPDGTVILPGGRKLTPAGRVLDLGGFPLGMRVLPGDRYVAVTDGAYGWQALRVVDLQAADPHAAVIARYEYPRTSESPHAPGLFLGMALTRDGKRLYVSNGGYDPLDSQRPPAEHYHTIDAFDLAPAAPGGPPRLVRNEAATIKLMWNADGQSGGAADPRLPAGITLSSDEKLLYVACQADHTLAIVELAGGSEIGRAPLPGIGPYDVALDEATHTAFVSLWGGTDRGADKGPARYVDGVAVVDVANPRAPVALLEPLATGKGAEAELLVAGKLYVANADADTLSIVDVASRTVKSMPVTAGMRLGAAPNHLAIEGGGGAPGRIYLADAGENALVVLDGTTFVARGRIATGWYPTAVAVLGDGTLVIASAKGLGLGPIDGPAWDKNYSYMQGILQVVPRPTDEDLKASEQVVATNFDRPRAYAATPTCSGTPARFPLPVEEPGGPSATPIRQVFLIVRENKTYDALLGDLAGTNADPKLVLFGESITPNFHALARAFTVFDNFYSLAEQSLQGHEWTTAAISNDYTEKAWQTTWGRAYRPVTTFAAGREARLALPGSDPIWRHLDRAGVAYKNYGEAVNTSTAKTGIDGQYPGLIFNIDVKDVEKVKYLIDKLDDPVPFSYIGLPNDHTHGTTPGKPTPQTMMADNDEATGRFVDALSHSPLWPTSVVFVIEDDPSDGGDHVEPHRSPALVISPWAKRGYVSHVNYDVAAVYRTIELLLGVGPMNINDAHAPPMYDVFTPTPDYTPYSYIPSKVTPATNAADAPLAAESARIDFTKPDQAPLGRILWKATHGPGAEPPWRKMPIPWEPDDDDD